MEEGAPPEAIRDEERDALVAVFSTADSMLLPIVRSALEAAGIPCVVQGEGAMGLAPLGRLGTGVTRKSMGAQVLVPRHRAAEARQFLDSIENEPPPDPEA